MILVVVVGVLLCVCVCVSGLYNNDCVVRACAVYKRMATPFVIGSVVFTLHIA